MAKEHNRSSSMSSDISITETVSTVRRFVFGNILRSQRQLVKFVLCVTVFLAFIYLVGPFSASTNKHGIPNQPKPAVVARSATEPKETEAPVSEYRATYFEDMAKKLAKHGLSNNPDRFHFSNDLKFVDDSEQEKLAKGKSKTSVKNGEGNGNGSSKAVNITKAGQSADSNGNLAVSLGEQTTKLDRVAEKVRRAAERLSKCKQVPGMSIVLVKGGNSVTIPVGLADVKLVKAVTENTRFLLNSITKTFLGQLLAVLITNSAGRLSWDTKVAEVLGPSFELMTEELTREVTLRDLLSHRSGLSSGNLAVRSTYSSSGRSRQEIVKLMKHLPLSTPFRQSFLYSNMGGLLATVVAETLGGMSWEKLVEDFLLKPIGMLDTKPLTTASELEDQSFSRLYVPVEGNLTLADTKIFDQGPLASVALLSTTGSDMSKWLQFNLRRGLLSNGRQLIHPDVWSDMWKKQADLSPMFLAGVDKSGNEWPVKDLSKGYGLFWFINSYRGEANYWHGGGLYTHYTLAWHFPQKDVALYSVINGYSGDAKPFSILEALSYYAADLLLGYPPWLDESSLCTYPSPQLGVKGQTRATEGKDKQGSDTSAREDQGGGIEGKTGVNGLLGVLQFGDKFRSKSFKFDNNPTGSTILGNVLNFVDRNTIPVVYDLQHDNRDDNNDLQVGAKFEKTALMAKSETVSLSKSAAQFPLEAYQGLYSHPLFENFSVSWDENRENLQCRMNVLSGVLQPIKSHTFGVELTGSLRFLSKPSGTAPAKHAFQLDFVESSQGQIRAVDVHSNWPMEVPLRFQKVFR